MQILVIRTLSGVVDQWIEFVAMNYPPITMPRMSEKKPKSPARTTKRTSKDYHSRPIVGLRISQELKDAVTEIAKRNHRSFTGEVTRLLEEFVARESQPQSDK